jgi:protein-tyrosine phosphatase
MKAAGEFDGYRMCVHEDGPLYKGQCYFIPILTTKPNSKWDRTGAIASIIELEKACKIIDQHVSNDEKILVHCMGGVERSPLTIAWYLVQWGQAVDLKDAYEFLKEKRPVVSDRRFWLP